VVVDHSATKVVYVGVAHSVDVGAAHSVVVDIVQIVELINHIIDAEIIFFLNSIAFLFCLFVSVA